MKVKVATLVFIFSLHCVKSLPIIMGFKFALVKSAIPHFHEVVIFPVIWKLEGKPQSSSFSLFWFPPGVDDVEKLAELAREETSVNEVLWDIVRVKILRTYGKTIDFVVGQNTDYSWNLLIFLIFLFRDVWGGRSSATTWSPCLLDDRLAATSFHAFGWGNT